MKCGPKERRRRRFGRYVDRFIGCVSEYDPSIEVRAVFEKGDFLVLRYPGESARVTMFMLSLISGDIDALATYAVQELARARSEAQCKKSPE